MPFNALIIPNAHPVPVTCHNCGHTYETHHEKMTDVIIAVKRLLRDVRLITTWSGTNEIMDLVIQHEFYKEFLAERPRGRDVEADAIGADLPELAPTEVMFAAYKKQKGNL